MARTISDEDTIAIASEVVNLLARRITAPTVPQPARPPELPRPKEVTPRLAYTVKQLTEELSISRCSIYRLEQRGLLKANPALRTKLYSRASVDRLLALSESDWNPK